jgi:biotin carboxyl carrier protein
MESMSHSFHKIVTRLGDEERVYEIGGEKDRYVVRSGESDRSFEWSSLGHGRYLFTIAGQPHLARVQQGAPGEYIVEIAGRQVVVRASDELTARATRAQEAGPGTTGPVEVRAPMPGTVIQVLVADGDSVDKGQALLIVEAMKMQNEIAAPISGIVSGIRVEPGQAVEARSRICRIDP